jgi:hypothetical protein
MQRNRKRTPHVQAPNLIPLESVLIAAEKLTPSRVPRLINDPDEELALWLIDRIKRPRPASFGGVRIELPRPAVPDPILERAGRDA